MGQYTLKIFSCVFAVFTALIILSAGQAGEGSYKAAPLVIMSAGMSIACLGGFLILRWLDRRRKAP